MLKSWIVCLALVVAANAAETPLATLPEAGAEPFVTGIKAACRNGQTFVTWKDAAEGEAGAGFRYSLYRSDQPITPENLAKAELCYPGMLNNSCKRIGKAYDWKDRLDPSRPTYVIEEGAEPLPMWTGLAVRTVPRDGKSFYAVVVTDAKYTPVGKIVPGQSATTEAVEEKVAPIQPIRRSSAKDNTKITGQAGLPLRLSLHGSGSRGTDCPDYGDVYAFFGTPEMGWRDGLPGVFSVYEFRGKNLIIFPSDSIENPRGGSPKGGGGAIETCWFGYYGVPVGAEIKEPRAYPFTERRLEWMVKWAIARYKADPLRVSSAGQSMGGMGSTQWAFRQPDLFAAVYPRLGRVRQSWLPACGLDLPGSIHKATWKKPAPMFDGKGDYFTDRMDSVKWVSEHHEDLPFYAFSFGKQDNVDTWEGNIEMVKALTANHHGFAFAWKNCGHSSEIVSAAAKLEKYYGVDKLALNKSYPAFGNSSINDNMGNGDRQDGDPDGCINLGFIWSDVVDEQGKWSVKLSNDLAKADMTVDVTPRRCQTFKAKPGEKFKWTNSAGGAGVVTADTWGLVTVEKVAIKPGESSVLTISRPQGS